MDKNVKSKYAIGTAFIAPFLTTLIASGMCMWIGKYMRPRQMDWVAATETRVTSVSYVVGCIKVRPNSQELIQIFN